MNDHGTKPPDKHQSGDILIENESILHGMVIKLEPTVKQELKEDDEIVTVSRPTHTANAVAFDNSIRDTSTNGNDNFSDFVGLTETKSGVKFEKVKEDVKQGPQKSSDKNQTQGNDVINGFSKGKKKPMSTGSNGGARKGVTESGRKANKFGDKKHSSAGKANRKIHKCSLCDYITNRKDHLKQHMLTHTGEKPFPCTICTKRFTRKAYLQSHIKKHVDEFVFSCSICLQGFHHSEEKVKHEAGCTIRRYECHLCKEYSTLQKTHFEEHMRVHTGDKPFQCDQCSKKFNQLNQLKSHRKTHTNPRPLKIQCFVCFKNFKQQKEKENHEANCKRRGYKCDVCKIYTTRYKCHLVRHMRIHTGEKPFRCEMCSKCFTRKGHLNSHMKIHKSKVILG